MINQHLNGEPKKEASTELPKLKRRSAQYTN